MKAFAEEPENKFEKYSDEFKKELDEDYEAYLKGEMEVFTLEEVKEKTRTSVKAKNSE